ncbi:class I SAM-dependent methyltransferase [Fodinicurvata halophila]|uniref:Class I SAM-dependent methyltransferase n=1 Tax=Fodinicurvata halophila TaxID=1419723 RepID=A0ABV8UJP2_9PROT
MNVSKASHCDPDQPASAWVCRFATLVPEGRPVLDIASGAGRHTRYFLGRGHPVVAVDHDVRALRDLEDRAGLTIMEADLEQEGRPPFAGRGFGAVVVTNYLHRPLLPALLEAVEPGGLLIYETFARGNERFGKPSNPDHLLNPGELLQAFAGRLHVLAYEDLQFEQPRPACIQRIVARREAA